MWLYKNEKLGTSGTYEMNFLFKEENIYIMDNHLAAAWCWISQLKLNEKVGLFHIDRHFDLLNNISLDFLNKRRDRFTGTFEEYIAVKNDSTDDQQVARFDNYINIYRALFPNSISNYYFATHDDGNKLSEIESYNVPIWDLQDNLSYWMESAEHKWIVNIDLDYFFQESGQNIFKFLTDEYIGYICEELKKAISKIAVITIALSPDFCGGWKQSFEILKIFTNSFNISFVQEWEI